MAIITPTITTNDPHEYRQQLELIATYAEGVHIDFADGELAPAKLLPLDQGWRTDDLITHVHIMYQKPLEVIEDILHLEADLVILHAEADDVAECVEILQDNGTRCGIALLPETTVHDLKELAIDDMFEHVLIFGGHLGYQGGEADMTQLLKVDQIRNAYPDVEIAWDGGVRPENVAAIAQAGVAVINVGSTLKNANNPKSTYASLVSLIQL